MSLDKLFAKYGQYASFPETENQLRMPLGPVGVGHKSVTPQKNIHAPQPWTAFSKTWENLPEKEEVYYMLLMQGFYVPSAHNPKLWGPKLYQAVIDYCKQHGYPATGNPAEPKLIQDAVSKAQYVGQKPRADERGVIAPGAPAFPAGSLQATPGAGNADVHKTSAIAQKAKKIAKKADDALKTLKKLKK